MSELHKRTKLPLTERLWHSVAKSDGCWEWHGSCNRDGYGQIGSKGKVLSTHRVSWEIHNGPIPEGLKVLHKCDNPKCVRPDHLFLGTQKDNVDDAVRKGRHPRKCGDDHPGRKLLAGDIPLIQRLVAIGFWQKDVAAAYGVSRSTLNSAVRGFTWQQTKKERV